MFRIPRDRRGGNQTGRSSTKQRRGGFTLIELLVVISIVGLLIALLLPAVQASREAARRTQCANHLKQIGLAFHNHHSQHGNFPTGGWHWKLPPSYISDNSPAIGADQQASWAFQILPFIDKVNVWQSDMLTALGSPIEIYFCPTRRPPQVFHTTAEYTPPIPGIVARSMIDYAASNKNKDGVVVRFEPKKFKDVVDGTSHTLMVGEKRMNVFFLGQPQRDDNEGYTAGWNSDSVRNTDRPPAADFSENDEDEDGDNHFGSSHPLGFNAVFVDGSVHRISYVIDRNVFEHLGTITGSEIILDTF